MYSVMGTKTTHTSILHAPVQDHSQPSLRGGTRVVLRKCPARRHLEVEGGLSIWRKGKTVQVTGTCIRCQQVDTSSEPRGCCLWK